MHTKESKRDREVENGAISRRLRSAAIAVAGAAMLASCGSGAGAGAADLSEADKTRVAEDFRECMAKYGLDANVDFEGGNLNIDVGSLEADQDPTLEQEKAAEEECEKLLEVLDGGSQLDPEDEARLIDAAPALQKCLREKGYDIEVDADGGISFESDGDANDGIDETEYLLAEDDCYKQVVPDLWEKFGEGN